MAASREPEHVIISRNGSVLGKKTILKSDHFPGCQNKRLLPHVEGAPNYRQVCVASYQTCKCSEISVAVRTQQDVLAYF